MALHLQDGSFVKYIANSEAFACVRAETHDWDDDSFKSVTQRPVILIAGGYCKEDWRVLQSGYAGPLVLQMETA